ncbi:MAG: nickel pincer cofactor biosynthesis protein LarC [Ignavibacteriales bacterium]|nr:nickel pincer cofactor biosynthesis protein LarC [Ignavibacteriales bacterium]
MKIAYFDTIGGISGDMTLGACLSAGVELEYLKSEIAKLNLSGVEINSNSISYHGVNAVQVKVVSNEKHHHRGLLEIYKIIDGSNLCLEIKNKSKKIFFTLGEAEAKIHNISIEKIHFHEVGAIDSIVDIVGSVICLDKLGVKEIYSTPIKLGSGGIIKCEHGSLPNPAPATIEILKDYPVTLTDIPHELTTPTGAAIIKSISSGMIGNKKITPQIIGYGAGAARLEAVPNLLRLVVGEKDETIEEKIFAIEANIDNMNPEIFPYVLEKLMQAGALDVYMTPIIMKKGRSANMLTALCVKENIEQLKKIFFMETTTLGVRIQEYSRSKIERQEEKRETSFGLIGVKVSKIDNFVRILPEFEDCKKVAKENGIPLIEVYKILLEEIQ